MDRRLRLHSELFDPRFTNLSLSSRRTINGPDDAASSHSAALGVGRAGPCLRQRRSMADSSCGTGPASLEYHGGLVLRRGRWTGPALISASQADSDYGVIYKTTTVPIRLSARPLTSPESLRNRAISRAEARDADRCLTDDALNAVLRASFAVAHIITPHRFGPYIRDEYRADRAFASCIMAMLNAIYDAPTRPPVDDRSTDSQALTHYSLPPYLSPFHSPPLPPSLPLSLAPSLPHSLPRSLSPQLPSCSGLSSYFLHWRK